MNDLDNKIENTKKAANLGNGVYCKYDGHEFNLYAYDKPQSVYLGYDEMKNLIEFYNQIKEEQAHANG